MVHELGSPVLKNLAHTGGVRAGVYISIIKLRLHMWCKSWCLLNSINSSTQEARAGVSSSWLPRWLKS